MLRGALVAVLAANLLFFAWARGWLAPMWPAPVHGEREPGRQAAQVRPELINVLGTRAASTAVAAAQAASMAAGVADTCLETAPLTGAEADAAEAALEQAGVQRASWARRPAAGTPAPDRFVLSLDRPSAALVQQLQALPDPVPRFRPCASPR